MSPGRQGWALLVALLALSGCTATYAPAVRGLHAGMPGRLTAGQLEVGGTAGGLALPVVGGPHLAFGLSDQLALEAGANLAILAPNWATGWAGVRWTGRRRAGQRLRLAGDLELGAGAGVGGMINGYPAGWDQRRVWGVYEGFGLGLDWRWAGAYLRARLDAASGDQTPATLWPSVLLGLEFRPFRWGAVGSGVGYAGYWNSRDRWVSFFFYQAQLTLIFDLAGQPGA